MPSSKNYKRDYKQEQKTARARGETKDRANRNRCRREAIKKGIAKKGDGKDLGHVTPLKKRKTSKCVVVSASRNRSHGGKIGNRAGKASGGRKGKRK